MRLQTLKDLEIVPKNIEVSLTEGIKAWETTEEHIKNQLKKEVIKWIKSSDYDISDNIIGAMESENFSPESVRIAFKHIFNITKGDLK